MKIAIDISSVVYGVGVSVYTKNLVSALLKVDKQNDYVLFAGTWRQRRIVENFYEELRDSIASFQNDDPNRVLLKILPISPRLQKYVWNDWELLNLEKFLGEIDIYHSPDWSLAPTSAKTIITVHDLFFLKRPDLQQHPYKDMLKERLVKACNYGFPAIAVSKSTKDDLVDLIGYPEDLITVIYESVDEKFKVQTSNFKRKEVINKYNLTKPYLLVVGTREPRKNMERILTAWKLIQNEQDSFKDYELVIAGRMGWGNDLSPSSGVRLLGYVPDEYLPVLYAESQGLVYPSLYEGFGIPVLEAFSTGVPVVTSNVSSMPEIGGNAAVYVDPYYTESIREGMEKLLSLNRAQKKKLVEKGYKQLKKFSWQRAAKETLKLYSKL